MTTQMNTGIVFKVGIDFPQSQVDLSSQSEDRWLVCAMGESPVRRERERGDLGELLLDPSTDVRSEVTFTGSNGGSPLESPAIIN